MSTPRIHLEKFWHDWEKSMRAHAEAVDVSENQIKALLDAAHVAWWAGALTGLTIAKEHCREAPVLRDEQIAANIGECWQQAKQEATPTDIN